MDNQRGICLNYGHCSTAEKHEVLVIPPCGAFICCECRKPLLFAPETRMRAHVFKLVLTACAMLGIIFGLFRFLSAEPAYAKAQITPPSAASDLMLRFAGSNTIGSKLLPALAEAYLKQQDVRSVKRLPGERQEKLLLVDADNPRPQTTIEITSHGSGTGFRALYEQKADIGMSSRRISGKEAGRLARIGDMTHPSKEHVLALDGIAIIVHRSNPVATLTRDQIGAIFAGVITDWAELNRHPGKIRLYARDEQSGTWDTFKSVVLYNLLLDESAIRFEDSSALSAGIAQDPDGIGFIGLPFVKNNKALAVSDTGAPPVSATRQTIATRDYPLSRSLYLYTPDTNTNGHVRKFIDFAMSRAGQEIVRQHGLVEPTISPAKADAATRRQKSATKTAASNAV